MGMTAEQGDVQQAPTQWLFPLILQAELTHSGLQPQSLEHINAQNIFRNGGHINSIFTGGQSPILRGSRTVFIFTLCPPITITRGLKPQRLVRVSIQQCTFCPYVY